MLVCSSSKILDFFFQVKSSVWRAEFAVEWSMLTKMAISSYPFLMVACKYRCLKLLGEAEHRLLKQHHTPTCCPGCRVPQLKHCPLAAFAPPLMFGWFISVSCSFLLFLSLSDYLDHSSPGSSCPWDSLGENTGVGCYAFLQGIFLTQGWNSCLLCLLHWQADSIPTSATWKDFQYLKLLNSSIQFIHMQKANRRRRKVGRAMIKIPQKHSWNQA